MKAQRSCQSHGPVCLSLHGWHALPLAPVVRPCAMHVAPAVKEFTNDGEYSTPARDAGCLGAENCIRSLDSCAVERPRPTAAITGDSSVTEKLPSKRAKRSRGNTPARRPPRWFSNAEVVPVMSKSAATTPNYLQSESIDNDSTIHSSSIGEDSYEGIRLVAEVRSILHAVCRKADPTREW